MMEDNDGQRAHTYNPIDQESPEERDTRMQMVRRIQKSFYMDEEGPTLLGAEGAESDTSIRNFFEDDAESAAASPSSTTIRKLPLWRVQWNELPGSQNILNVHVPHYTNMFQKILKGRSRKWGDSVINYINGDDDKNNCYFGHVFLPGGSENLDNPEHALSVGDTGVLMKIADSRQQTDDGRLTLVVQALERFVVTRVVRSHSPYAIADVEILPDEEQVIDAAQRRAMDDVNEDTNESARPRAKVDAVAEAFANHKFEFRRVTIDECEVHRPDGQGTEVRVSPLSNFDALRFPTLPKQQEEDEEPLDRHHRDLVAVAESDTWIQVDNMLKLLRMVSGGYNVPVPTQMLGLLPRFRSVAEIGANGAVVAKKVPWPEDFDLHMVLKEIELAPERSAYVGTHSKSPFVRVDDGIDGSYRCGYSPLRRAQRLSYVVWSLTESIDLASEGDDDEQEEYGPQKILELGTTRERLELATEKMNKTNNLVRKILRLLS